jgi:proline dehydrogenase
MSMMRKVLLAISENRWMREHGQKLWFVRRAVRRFMPGEEFDDMMAAAATLKQAGIDTVFTRLGENVTDPAEADAVTAHYLDGLDRIARAGLRAEPSVKLTQLGLDLDPARCYDNLRALARKAQVTNTYAWIDMEQSAYVDATLELVRRVHRECGRIGVCLQAYLYRTHDDLTSLMQEGIGIRLVKGAYLEPPSVAFPKKADVDENYFVLATKMLEPDGRNAGSRPVFGTHDTRLIARIRAHAERAGIAPRDVEVHMLYGIQRDAETQLAREGLTVRVLIAYGPYWFPWYMRRLAERPANVWFVLRSAL